MAHPDLDRLLSFCIPFAQDQLKKHDGFHPFAAVVDAGEDVKPVAIYEGEEHPQPTEMIEKLTWFIKSLVPTEGITASAICYDGRVTVTGKDKQDAITVSLEQVNGEAVTIYVPYEKKLFRGYQYGDLIATTGPRQIFS